MGRLLAIALLPCRPHAVFTSTVSAVARHGRRLTGGKTEGFLLSVFVSTFLSGQAATSVFVEQLSVVQCTAVILIYDTAVACLRVSRHQSPLAVLLYVLVLTGCSLELEHQRNEVQVLVLL